MSGGHFFDIFWTFFQRQPQHQDTFQTLFGHFSGRLPGSPKRHFGTLFGHSSATSRFDPFYDLRCFPFFFSFFLFCPGGVTFFPIFLLTVLVFSYRSFFSCFAAESFAGCRRLSSLAVVARPPRRLSSSAVVVVVVGWG